MAGVHDVSGGEKCNGTAVLFYGNDLPRPAAIFDKEAGKMMHEDRENAVNGLLGGVPEPKAKLEKLPRKWKSAIELFAEDKHQWNKASAYAHDKATSLSVFKKDAPKLFEALPEQEQKKFEAQAEEARKRYETEIAKWNATRPEDQLVFNKAGIAHRKQKSRVDADKQERLKEERALKKELKAKRDAKHRVHNLPDSMLKVAASAKARLKQDKANKRAARGKAAEPEEYQSMSEGSAGEDSAGDDDTKGAEGGSAEEDDVAISSDDDAAEETPAAFAPEVKATKTKAGKKPDGASTKKSNQGAVRSTSKTARTTDAPTADEGKAAVQKRRKGGAIEDDAAGNKKLKSTTPKSKSGDADQTGKKSAPGKEKKAPSGTAAAAGNKKRNRVEAAAGGPGDSNAAAPKRGRAGPNGADKQLAGGEASPTGKEATKRKSRLSTGKATAQKAAAATPAAGKSAPKKVVAATTAKAPAKKADAAVQHSPNKSADGYTGAYALSEDDSDEEPQVKKAPAKKAKTGRLSRK